VRVQSELWAAIDEVNRRSRPDVVLLETTGIAEPWSILSGLEDLGDAAPAVAAGVVCVIDAEAGAGQLARHEEARAQVEAADRILLTKLDLAAADAVVALHAELARRNPPAERASFPPGEEGGAALVPWLLDARAPRASRAARHAHAHAHGQLSVVTFTDPEPLLREPLLAVIEGLGDALVRAKGFVNLAGDDRRGFIERAGARTGLAAGDPWGAAARSNEIVLIGDALDGDAIRRQLWACRARAG
jgi:G3E family GTPase